MEVIVVLSFIEDMFDKLEEWGVLLCIDKKVRFSMFYGVMVSELEFKVL